VTTLTVDAGANLKSPSIKLPLTSPTVRTRVGGADRERRRCLDFERLLISALESLRTTGHQRNVPVSVRKVNMASRDGGSECRSDFYCLD